MADLNSLGLTDEPIDGLDYEAMPTNLGTFLTVPQPGIYTFRIPEKKALFGAFDIELDAEGNQRLVAKFRDDTALFNETLGEYYNGRISNRTRSIKIKDSQVLISDMGVLLKVLEIPFKPSNAGMAQAMLEAAGRRFKAEHTLTSNCNPKNDIYKDGAVQKGVKGCGLRFEVEFRPGKGGKADTLAIPRTEDNKVSTRFTCACGAEIRCFGQLRGFRSAE